jgi:hypothetical protein
MFAKASASGKRDKRNPQISELYHVCIHAPLAYLAAKVGLNWLLLPAENQIT